MSYEKNLGRVKGEQGVAFYPTATIQEDRVVINWHCTEDNYSGTLPQSTTIIPMVYYPHYDSETGLLSWTKRQDEGLPAQAVGGRQGDRQEAHEHLVGNHQPCEKHPARA